MTNTKNADDWRANLRAELKKHRWQHVALSKEAGLSEDYVSKMLNNRFEPTVARLRHLCDVAGVDFISLFQSSSAKESTKTVEDVYAKVGFISAEDAKLVHRILQKARSE